MPTPTQESDRQLQLFGDSEPLVDHGQVTSQVATPTLRPVLRLVVGSARAESQNRRAALAEETISSIENRLLTRVRYF